MSAFAPLLRGKRTSACELRQTEDQTDFVREAVERELKKRATKDKTDR